MASVRHGPRPVLRAGSSAGLMIVGRSPDTKVHASGVPWDDRSGERLRGWLAVGPEIFYDDNRIAIIPMGLCFPGQDAKGGDFPLRKERAPAWHPLLHDHFSTVELALLVGQYAQRYYLGSEARPTLTETVRAWREFRPPSSCRCPIPPGATPAGSRKIPGSRSSYCPSLAAASPLA